MLRSGYISVPRTSLLSTNRMPEKESESNGLLQIPLRFPPTRSVLWDHRDVGPPSVIHITQCKNPLVLIDETVLRLAQRLTQDSTVPEFSFLLGGKICTEPDGSGVTISIDRLDTSKGVSASRVVSAKSLIAGRMDVPFVMTRNSPVSRITTEDLMNSLRLIEARCQAARPIDLCHFMSLRVYGSCHQNPSTPSTSLFQLDLSLVYPGVSFRVTPVNAIPIIPTALSKNLCSPLNITEVQGEAKSGYLSMDHTRKLLLVLESDPKCISLPVVGIWIAGLANVEDPFVWASLLRYVFNSSLKDRVCLPPEPFLVIFFSSVHSKPEYYECVTTNGRRNLEFDFSTCHDVIQTNKDNAAQLGSSVEMELEAVADGDQLNTFQAALHIFRSEAGHNSKVPHRNSSTLDDVDQPRINPVTPYCEKELSIKPSVPEVTLLFDSHSCNKHTQHQMFSIPNFADQSQRSIVQNVTSAASHVESEAQPRHAGGFVNQVPPDALLHGQYLQGFFTSEIDGNSGSSHSNHDMRYSHSSHQTLEEQLSCSGNDNVQHWDGSGQAPYMSSNGQSSCDVMTMKHMLIAERTNQVHAASNFAPPTSVQRTGRRYMTSSVPDSMSQRVVQPGNIRDTDAVWSQKPAVVRAQQSVSVPTPLTHARPLQSLGARMIVQHKVNTKVPQAGYNAPSTQPKLADEKRFTSQCGGVQRVQQLGNYLSPQTAMREMQQRAEGNEIPVRMEATLSKSNAVSMHHQQRSSPGPAMRLARSSPCTSRYSNPPMLTLPSSPAVQSQFEASRELYSVQSPAASLLPFSVSSSIPTASSAPECQCCCQDSPQLNTKSSASGEGDRQSSRRSLPSQSHEVEACGMQGRLSVGNMRKSPTCRSSSAPIGISQEDMQIERSESCNEFCMGQSCSYSDVLANHSYAIAAKTSKVEGGNRKVETVDSLLSALCEPCSSLVDSHLVATGNNSGSTDSGLQVNEDMSSSSSNTSLRATDEAEMGTWTVSKQLDSIMANGFFCAEQPRSGFESPTEPLSTFTDDSGLPKQTCSVAVNTSLFWPTFPSMERGSSVNQGPRLVEHMRHEERSTKSGSCCHHSTENTYDGDLILNGGNTDQRQLSDAMEHRDWTNGSRTDRSLYHERQEHGVVDESYCPPPMPMFVNPSEESVASEMIVDMIEYESPSPEKSDLYQMSSAPIDKHHSNLSVGEGLCADIRPRGPDQYCQRKRRSVESSRCSAAEDGQNIGGNLSFSSSSRSSGSRKVVDVLLEQSQNLDPNCHFEPTVIDFDETVMLQSAFLPKLNYIAANMDQSNLESRSAADMTAIVNAVNAAAVKYLNDKQLVQQVQVAADRRSANRSKGSRNQVSPAANAVSNASVYGVKSANLSMASRKYFEKHGLMGQAPAINQGNRRRDALVGRSSLLESITSQVNNLHLAASPSRLTDCEATSEYDPSLYDARGQEHGTWLSDRDTADCKSECDAYSGNRSFDVEHDKFNNDRSTLSDTTYNHQHYDSVRDTARMRSSNHMILRAVDRTLEFSDSVVVDSPEPRQRFYRQ